VALVFSSLDYGSATLAGLPKQLTDRLQSVEQSAGVNTGIAVTASFSQQTEDRAFCPVVQLL